MTKEIQIQQSSAGPAQEISRVALKPRFTDRGPEWNLAARIAFRFCFVYFSLFALSTQILSGLLEFPGLYIPGLGVLWPLRQITFWAAVHIFRITHPLVYTGSGSGDKTFDWVQISCLIVIAAVTTAIWSVLDRRRKSYIVLHKWFHLFIRFCLICQMMEYGLNKAIPLQMPYPYLSTLLQPFGNLSPMGVLWWSIGASRPYQIFTGCAEVLGGILLIFPRTTNLGALVCLADMVQVFVLNMSYDVPVKLFSFHLILFSLFLLAPEMRRIFSFFFSNNATGPSSRPPLFRSLRANRMALALQLVFGFYLLGINLYQEARSWHIRGGGRPRPSLYGIWDVEEMSVDGQLRPPLLTDRERWRRVIFDFPTFTTYQRLDDSFGGYRSTINDQAKTLTFTKPTDQRWSATFSFQRPALDQVTLDGSLDNHKIHMQLKLLDVNSLTLVNRGFHWVTEYSFLR